MVTVGTAPKNIRSDEWLVERSAGIILFVDDEMPAERFDIEEE